MLKTNLHPEVLNPVATWKQKSEKDNPKIEPPLERSVGMA